MDISSLLESLLKLSTEYGVKSVEMDSKSYRWLEYYLDEIERRWPFEDRAILEGPKCITYCGITIRESK